MRARWTSVPTLSRFGGLPRNCSQRARVVAAWSFDDMADQCRKALRPASLPPLAAQKAIPTTFHSSQVRSGLGIALASARGRRRSRARPCSRSRRRCPSALRPASRAVSSRISSASSRWISRSGDSATIRANRGSPSRCHDPGQRKGWTAEQPRHRCRRAAPLQGGEPARSRRCSAGHPGRLAQPPVQVHLVLQLPGRRCLARPAAGDDDVAAPRSPRAWIRALWDPCRTRR